MVTFIIRINAHFIFSSFSINICSQLCINIGFTFLIDSDVTCFFLQFSIVIMIVEPCSHSYIFSVGCDTDTESKFIRICFSAQCISYCPIGTCPIITCLAKYSRCSVAICFGRSINKTRGCTSNHHTGTSKVSRISNGNHETFVVTRR